MYGGLSGVISMGSGEDYGTSHGKSGLPAVRRKASCSDNQAKKSGPGENTCALGRMSRAERNKGDRQGDRHKSPVHPLCIGRRRQKG